MSHHVHKILIYSHNAIGLGHMFRVLAVINGIKGWRPDIEFLVVSGTSVPHVLLSHGIEVIKLPSVKKFPESPDSSLVPRYLNNTRIEDILEYRKQILLGAFEFFRPDVLMIEHYLEGLSGEILPLLEHKMASRGTAREFLLVHLCRGIFGQTHRDARDVSGFPFADSISLYDLMYVFEERNVIDLNTEHFGNDPLIDGKIRYVGKITEKNREEISSPMEVIRRFRLSEKPIILLHLSRHGNIEALSGRLVESLSILGISLKFQVVMVLDPYLESGVRERLRKCPLFREVRFLPFSYPLIDLIHASELVICRAGYNTINELLLTDTRAIVIPEHHVSGEQERRANLLPRDNIVVMGEREVLGPSLETVLREILCRPKTLLHFRFDKYRIGREMIGDMEARLNRG
ncbi:glycosyltransferase family protein [Desulfatirhabdium butyrativorans]|uniref:glycosyltransferase family protein n=1 Tax=Desulfatirhabdium butyrativorans TaxID=340467 RepID=UPI000410D18B|nr:glycosyltransferase [Desulfatirhabdium butyrativorans]